jgi:hypothetical protein
LKNVWLRRRNSFQKKISCFFILGDRPTSPPFPCHGKLLLSYFLLRGMSLWQNAVIKKAWDSNSSRTPASGPSSLSEQVLKRIHDAYCNLKRLPAYKMPVGILLTAQSIKWLDAGWKTRLWFSARAKLYSPTFQTGCGALPVLHFMGTRAFSVRVKMVDLESDHFLLRSSGPLSYSVNSPPSEGSVPWSREATEREPFLRSCQLWSYSRTSQQFKEPEGSLPCSQEPSTSPCHQPDRSSPHYPILSL